MSDLRTLSILIDQASAARDEALAQHTEAQAQLSRARQQADGLLAYQSEYHARWQAQGRQGLGVETLRCYQSFAARLTDAIGQQDQLLQHLEGQLQLARMALQERELRLASLGKLLERRQSELQQLAHRQEQKLNDEWAARGTRSRSPSPIP